MILGMLASLVRCCIIKLKIITRRKLGGDVPVPLMTICSEVATTCMRDDVIIVNICMVNSTWLVAVIERREATVLMSPTVLMSWR
jgi:hypothetical protein